MRLLRTNRTRGAAALLPVLALLNGAQAEDVPMQVFDIGSRLELFVSPFLIARLARSTLHLHTPQMLPLAQSPVRGSYMTVIKDGDLYRAYYRETAPGYTGPTDYSGHPGEITCYAESRDGREWTFPQLGLFELNGSTANNAVLAGQPPFSHNFSPFLDTRGGVDPSERFKALAGHPGRDRKRRADGLHAFVSGDGLRWTRSGTAAVIPYDPAWSHAFDSQNVAFWSEPEGCYVCYFRTYESPHGRLRAIFRTTSTDFATWTTPVSTEANRPGEHLYTSQAHPYFRAPHLVVALPTRFQPQRGDSTDILFMTSRAGSAAFDRTFPEAFIRPGLDRARWGNRSNYAALNVVPTGPHEMSIYHARSGHRYVLRTDGFASVRTGSERGEMLTKPLRFAGSRLFLNLSTSAGGDLRVEIQQPDGTPLPGFGLDDCLPAIGDAIALPIRWRDDPDLGAVAGLPVRLRFVMAECDLFALQFR